MYAASDPDLYTSECKLCQRVSVCYQTCNIHKSSLLFSLHQRLCLQREITCDQVHSSAIQVQQHLRKHPYSGIYNIRYTDFKF